jgi:two-component system, NtrC family, sensor kinase
MVTAFLLVACAPLFLVSGVILRQFSHSFREKMHAHLGELVQKHRQNIDGFLNEQLNIIRYAASSYSYDQLCDEEFLQQLLSRLQQQFIGVFEDLGVVEESGLQLAYAGPLDLLKADYSNADWFQKAAARQTFISDVFLGLRGRPHFIVAVRQTHGDRHWILRATIDFRAFNTLVENLRIGETGMVFIVNQENEFQTRPAENTPAQRTIYKKLTADREVLNPDTGIIEEISDSSGKYIFAGATLKNGSWLLVCQQDAADAYQDLHFAEKITILILLLGCFAIITTAWLISRRFVFRITEADHEVDLMNRQVVETGKLAAIGELAAGIAHEINNPVAIMMEKAGWMQDLLEEENSKTMKNIDEFDLSLEEIKNQARRCKDITHKLLGFSRKTDSHPQLVQINTVLEDIIALSTDRARYAGVVFHKTLQDDLPELSVSPAEMQQLFLNLINNAVDAMDKTGGRINIVTAFDSDHVSVEIADSGPGIPKSNIGRIFEPFFTTKPVGKGTGLGLSICYSIINKLGGQIDVMSEVDKGATFRIRIPISTHHDGKEPND